MSLNDKILEILKKEPMLSTEDIKIQLEKIGEDRNLRTIQRHIEELSKNRKVTMSGYDRRKRRPLYIIWDEGTKYNSIMDCPEISEVDWSKIPREIINPMVYLWWRGKKHPQFRDWIRLTLKTFVENGDSKSLIEKINERISFSQRS
jgi:hypothetical protein